MLESWALSAATSNVNVVASIGELIITKPLHKIESRGIWNVFVRAFTRGVNVRVVETVLQGSFALL